MMKEQWDLSFSILAWAFGVCNLIIVVGSSDAIVRSIDPSVTDQWTTIPHATFFAGSALVSAFGGLDALFAHEGRKFTFFVGTVFSLAGTILGVGSLMLPSRTVFAAATACFGAANGITLQLRFAVRDMPSSRSATSTTAYTVGGGGLLAALLAGPVATKWANRLFDMEDTMYEYMGVFLLAGIYSAAGALCIAMIDFGDSDQVADAAERSIFRRQTPRDSLDAYIAVLWHRSFVVPLLLSALIWIVMFLPMCTAPMVMRQTISTSGANLATQLHLLSMFVPGPVLVGCCCCSCSKPAPSRSIGASVALSAIGLLLLLLTSSSAIPITLGLMCTGLGWGFGFLYTTERTAVVPSGLSALPVQCAHDSYTFLLVGIAMTAASLIVVDRNGDGWKVVIGVAMALMGIILLLLAGDWIWRPQYPPRKELEQQQSSLKSRNSDSSKTMVVSNKFVVGSVIPSTSDNEVEVVAAGNDENSGDEEEGFQQSVEKPEDALQESNHEQTDLDRERQDRKFQDAARGNSLADSYDDDDDDDDSELSIYVDDEEATLPPPPPPLLGEQEEFYYYDDYHNSDEDILVTQKSYRTASTDEETRDSEEQQQQPWPDDEMVGG